MPLKEKNIIPIFPLPTVLLPNSSLLLNIYEERYKKMIIDCLTLNDNFGICYINDNKISQYGCTAKITKVEQSSVKGEMDIVVNGWDRFKVEKLIDSGVYLKAQVVYFTDDYESIDENLTFEVLNLYNELYKVVFKSTIDLERLQMAIPLLSFKVAEKIGMLPEERQRLLEIRSENNRLKLIIEFLKKILPQIKDYSKLQEIINNNGYL
ncbi:MAG TPA: LON peptidase substrate-binding domain-containing protein [Ignavibacteria bacterium]